ncbi:MAG: DegT/DnrJ/EryC1/StrS aminotransferase family protein [Defluviitaleaceae bacterium]|nr:DegT/DnrJ/EryC1/StrS aminotransferase family protein [Defluviitaleaceae bacterium]MCL2238344.1 DegT/DnrJ/EryC1/StrS aminotransferase family protein [Defluviitaleaceae bacterium]
MYYPLMDNNIIREDLDALIEFLKGDHMLTQSKNVRKFEEQWSNWLGVKHSVFVNSGASANLATIGMLKQRFPEGGEIIVPPLTWVSDVASVLWNQFTPVFADIDMNHLGMDTDKILEKITDKTRAVFITYVLGFNCLTEKLVNELDKRGIILIEDVCESHGATWNGKKLGSIGWASNFSFYYAHHMSTIEGGMICTNDDEVYNMARLFRSHGMTRESLSQDFKDGYIHKYPDLNPEFIFAYPALNIRSTELNAVLGLAQLPRLDNNVKKRNENFSYFLNNLNPNRYKTDFDLVGMSNYAFTLILKHPDADLWKKVRAALTAAGVEYRCGTAGGGNQLRQPYLKGLLDVNYDDYPHVDHVHFYGMYLGNYPDLAKEKIEKVCKILNEL